TGDIGSLEAAVENMIRTTNGRVALIVMTHRHADHIAGFARHADKFRKMEVSEIWMSIWESQYEQTAVKFQAELARTALELRKHFAAVSAPSYEQHTARKYLENATGELDLTGAGGSGSNATALDLLKHGFPGVTPRYYTAGDKAELPQA